ncbi:hypothetical protein F2Q70_00021363 [Brassica cretica]|uniref:Uncharacterized protein n=1 Tax=Brassica cretica TaxID=69181 RepID=A0A8S9GUV4_BRACR|nr:hypothetical protein F2Q70_00021363 [Brassica cretica]
MVDQYFERMDEEEGWEDLKIPPRINLPSSIIAKLSVTPAPKMTSAVSPVANAVVDHSTFNSLRLGRTSQFVVGRLIRFWDSRNIKKNGEFMGIKIMNWTRLFTGSFPLIERVTTVLIF